MRILITGIAGFYGHNFAKYILEEKPDWEIIGIDRIDPAGNLNRLSELPIWEKAAKEGRAKFIWHDLRSPVNDFLAGQIGPIDAIFHIAAASHVNRSIEDPIGFILDNVVGTGYILEFARKHPELKYFNYFSTDEVFGPIPEGGHKFKDWDRFKPGNPYAATKAGGEDLAICYHNTYGTPVVVTHCMNIVGERQHPEKYMPRILRAILKNETLTVHTDESGVVPSRRHYIYVDDVSRALLFLMEKGTHGEKYNIEGAAELDNLEFAKLVAKIYNKGELEFKLVRASIDRPGHDWAYGLDATKLYDMGWKHKNKFEIDVKKILDWYEKNPHWL